MVVFNRKRRRKKRFVAEWLQKYIGAVSLSALRLSINPELIWVDKFGNKEEEEKKELEKNITSKVALLKKLKAESWDKHEKNTALVKAEKTRIKKLVAQFRADFRLALETLNQQDKQDVLDELCVESQLCKQLVVSDLIPVVPDPL